jgi:hypothetical protein
MIGVGIQLALERGLGLHFDRLVCGVRVSFSASEPVDPLVFGMERPQHMIEGAILHHEHHNVFQVIQSE